MMRQERYDVVVIGSGAGGGTLAYALSQTPARVLIVERGDFIPQEDANWDPEAVWKHLRYQTKEVWLDAGGREFPPYSHYNVGGNSKFWGSVLYRLRREDFQDLQHLDGLSPGWPIDSRLCGRSARVMESTTSSPSWVGIPQAPIWDRCTLVSPGRTTHTPGCLATAPCFREPWMKPLSRPR